MKKILSLIFIGAVIAFTGCTEEPNTSEPSYINETKLTKATEENMAENTTEVEVSDEEYLINLGKQLKLGMTEKEVIDKIGEPDDHVGSGVYVLVYRWGDSGLSVFVNPQEDEVYEVRVHNNETNKTTFICSIYDDETETTE